MQTRTDVTTALASAQSAEAPRPLAAAPGTRIAIVGAGMSGLLMAMYLQRRGFRVNVYERRPDPRRRPSEQNRSINMTLSTRGLEALRQVGLSAEIERIVTPLKGRVIHAPEGTMFQPYGKNEHEILYSVRRSDLNALLLDAVERLSDITISFEERLMQLDSEHGVLTFLNEDAEVEHRVESDVIIGADGAFSAVRQHMMRGLRADYQQECLDWGYKELSIPVDQHRCDILQGDGLHVWAREGCMLIGTATHDGSFTLTCFMPFEGETSFAAFQSEVQVTGFFSGEFPELAPFLPSMVNSFMKNRADTLLTTRCSPWHFGGRVVLIGDACHSVYPFYGQGMNAALEDCRVLDECITAHEGDWAATFQAFQEARKRNTDVLAELSKQNFVELSQRVNSHRFQARKKIDLVLNRLFPNRWIPLYTLVSHTTMPYADAVERVNRQHRRAGLLGLNVAIGAVATMLAIKESYGLLTQRLFG